MHFLIHFLALEALFHPGFHPGSDPTITFTINLKPLTKPSLFTLEATFWGYFDGFKQV
jgi:hypothetical protein